jgi:tRNA-dihydrouridine synthase 3
MWLCCPDIYSSHFLTLASLDSRYLVFGGPNRAADETADDQAEAAHHEERETGGKKGKRRGGKERGQNTNRRFGSSQDERPLCGTRSLASEFTPEQCPFGDGCRFEHDLRKYLKQYKREDLTTFNGRCPVWDVYGVCFSGWRCRFVGFHMAERELPDGRKELVLMEDEAKKAARPPRKDVDPNGVTNSTTTETKVLLTKRKFAMPKSEAMIKWFDEQAKVQGNETPLKDEADGEIGNGYTKDTKDQVADNRARYTEPPFRPSEKRRLYFGPETPVLAPLTTQGNLPFRRLCVELGAQFTYSEMAMSLPLMQGTKGEWALLRAHESEALPPTFTPKNVVTDYDQSKDLKFGAQIAGAKYWQAMKATEVITSICPNLRVVDLNCGCPIDLVFKAGAGSALMESHSRLEKMLRGMNHVSGEVPVSIKIRMGTKDKNPTALKLAERLVLGGTEARQQGLGPPGVAAITLHGRSRQQRYTRQADWEYISECAALIKRLNEKGDAAADTINEADGRDQAPGGKVYFLGNGDCYSHVDYYRAIEESGVDSVMIARGALMKPWIFEEIQAGQYLDKSASERLCLVEMFSIYGLETWGSDEQGVGTTRRFLLEYLSFTYRYVPVGLLEYLPPNIQDRPPTFKGRNELETLLASDNYKDWIKIS